MIWVILCGLIVLIKTLRSQIKSDGWIAFTIWVTIVGLLIGVLVDFIIGGIIGSFLPKQNVAYSDEPICALSDGTSVSGHFFLGSGTVDEQPVYYYISEGKYGKQVNTIPTAGVYLKTDDSNPRISRIQPTFKDKNAWWYAFPWDDPITIIYIPEGSVTTEFKVDLK